MNLHFSKKRTRAEIYIWFIYIYTKLLCIYVHQLKLLVSQALLNKGAQYIVVQGLPTIGCLTLPLSLAPEGDRDDIGCVQSENKQSYTHNTILQAKLQQLIAQFPHATILYADYWNAYQTILKNANKYGLKELYKVCCGSGGGQYNFNLTNTCGSYNSRSCPNPSQYINWDEVHLTEVMYKVVSKLFLNGTFCHPSFNYLLNKKQNRSGLVY